MPEPFGFSWINKPLLAAMAEPLEFEEFEWLRQQGIQLLISLTENAPRRDWINDAGLLLLHEPVEDMTAPTQAQLDRIISAICRAHHHKMGVGINCSAGLGRTGVILACYFVDQGLSAQNAIARVRRLRPNSIETEEQADAIREYAHRKGSAPEEKEDQL